MALETWEKGSFTAATLTRDTYRKGSGPVVIVVHEIPGITPAVERFADDVVHAGFTVVMPNLVGTAGQEVSGKYIASSMLKVCISKEFTNMALQKTSPIIAWLRALARSLHQEVGGKGVGAVGMCFSGGFALGMMVDDIMVAPVLSQPSMPFTVGKLVAQISICRLMMRLSWLNALQTAVKFLAFDLRKTNWWAIDSIHFARCLVMRLLRLSCHLNRRKITAC
jgi:hypothetical protein